MCAGLAQAHNPSTRNFVVWFPFRKTIGFHSQAGVPVPLLYLKCLSCLINRTLQRGKLSLSIFSLFKFMFS